MGVISAMIGTGMIKINDNAIGWHILKSLWQSTSFTKRVYVFFLRLPKFVIFLNPRMKNFNCLVNYDQKPLSC